MSHYDTSTIIGVDTGGTFTDFFAVDPSGQVRVDKRPSVPDDPARPVVEGVATDLASGSARVVHGTTVATNALLQRKFGRAALITTAGFEDILEIGRQDRPKLYDIHPSKPTPLIPHELRFGITERILSDGSVRDRLDTMEVESLLRRIKDLNVDAVAVCMLHSYANPVHEEAVGRMAQEAGLTVSLSCRVLREFREYERTSTVAVNAVLRPVMEDYLNRLGDALGRARLGIMQSSGGILPPRMAAELPVHTILSGPAGGVTAAAYLARVAGVDRCITFDMGGTSTDVSVYDRGASYTTERIVAGHPVRVRMMDIHTVGAGGGSIASVDRGGGLKVGPLSAGADPGPACYGKGRSVTVTDANLFLGRLDEQGLLAGKLTLDRDRTRESMEDLARSMGIDETTTAQGILDVANSVMERAIRVITVERGLDPRDFTLVSFGGAGGLHACELAASLGISKVLVPVHCGVFSALGMAVASVRRDYSRTVLVAADEKGLQRARSVAMKLMVEGRSALESEGLAGPDLTAQAWLDMRYKGQSHELSVPMSSQHPAAFEATHQRAYGFCRPGEQVEIVTVRVRVTQPGKPPELVPATPGGPAAPRAHRTQAAVLGNQAARLAVYERGALVPGTRFHGPALVTETTATTLVSAGALCEVDPYGNIKIHLSDVFC